MAGVMADGLGLDSWGHASQIDHAVASDPMGVFRKVDVALPKWAHNASPLRAPNGSYLLFHIGDADKTGGDSGFLHHSESPEGPWYALPGLGCNNPAPVIHSNGTYFCGCNDGGFKIYRSDDAFKGNWEYVTTMDFPESWKSPSELRNEDVCLCF